VGIGKTRAFQQKFVFLRPDTVVIAPVIDRKIHLAGRSDPPEDTSARFSSDEITTLKPRARVQNSSSTEMSNDSEVTASQVPGAVPSGRPCR
jgi:hypothetical protein